MTADGQLEIRTARPGEEDRLARFCAEAFGISPAYFERRWAADPVPGSFGLVLEVEGELVAHLHVFERLLQLGDRAARCAGVGDVSVSPQHRGRGYSQELMRTTMVRCQDLGYEVSLLYTHAPGIYDRFGFEVLPVHEVRLPQGSGESWSEGELTDQDRVLYEKSHGGRPGTVRRDAAYWEARTRWLRAEGWKLLKAEGLDGYCWTIEEDGERRVDEAAGECAAKALRSPPGLGAWRGRLPLGEEFALPEAPPSSVVPMAAALQPRITLDSLRAPGAVNWLADAF